LKKTNARGALLAPDRATPLLAQEQAFVWGGEIRNRRRQPRKSMIPQPN